MRRSVKIRYSDEVDYKEYEPKIKKLLDTHIQADEVVQLNKPFNIFDDDQFTKVMEEQAVYGDPAKASKADTIAHALKKVTTEKMDEDPAFYEKFSKLIQQIIDQFREDKITASEYLSKIVDVRRKVTDKIHDDVPDSIRGNEEAAAYFGVIKPFFIVKGCKTDELEKASAETATEVQRIFDVHKKIHFWDDEDEQNQVINEIDDYLFDVVIKEKGIGLSVEQMDGIIEKSMRLARHRSK